MNGRIQHRGIFEDEWILEVDRYWESGSATLQRYLSASGFLLVTVARDPDLKADSAHKHKQKGHA